MLILNAVHIYICYTNWILLLKEWEEVKAMTKMWLEMLNFERRTQCLLKCQGMLILGWLVRVRVKMTLKWVWPVYLFAGTCMHTLTKTMFQRSTSISRNSIWRNCLGDIRTVLRQLTKRSLVTLVLEVVDCINCTWLYLKNKTYTRIL
jgi:hypothetical protein